MTRTEKYLNWGLLSTAGINRHVIPAIEEAPHSRLAAVASRDLQRARAYAKQWNIQNAYGSYEELLADPEIDVVYISLPNHMHAAWSIRALEAGKHVLCEKPLALSIDEVQQMIRASKLNDRRLSEAFMYYHHPQAAWLRDFVKSGKLGEIQLIRSAFSFYLESNTDIRRNPEFGGGALRDIGVYPVSIAQMITGAAPETVRGHLTRGETGVDETFTGELYFAGGATAQIAASFRSPYYTRVDVLGTQGQIVMTQPFHNENAPGQVQVSLGGAPFDPAEIKSKPLYLGEVEDMNAAILTGSPNAFTLDLSLQQASVIQALYQSAEQGQEVTVNSLTS